jgi:hypothetical protein
MCFYYKLCNQIPHFIKEQVNRFLISFMKLGDHFKRSSYVVADQNVNNSANMETSLRILLIKPKACDSEGVHMQLTTD